MTVQNPLEKRIPVMEIFGPTIQGEGAVLGQGTYFIRFGLCDYKCTMCDSMHAVDPISVKNNADWLTQEEIFLKFQELCKGKDGPKWITFSGGNPCIHDLSHLCKLFINEGYKIHVETQGSIPAEWLKYCNLVTVSPKGVGMGETTDINALEYFLLESTKYTPVAMKIVVFCRADLEFAKELYYAFSRTLYTEQFYLSLGNPYPPTLHNADPIDHTEHLKVLIDEYKCLYEEIKYDKILSRMKFLPQWHVFVWGNARGV